MGHYKIDTKRKHYPGLLKFRQIGYDSKIFASKDDGPVFLQNRGGSPLFWGGNQIKLQTMQNLVIVPTYNEKENILSLIMAIFEEVPETQILVVDDGSPDGTGGLVKEFMKTNPKVHILENSGKNGLGKAYLQGFDWALKRGFDSCVQMDADFSHRPQDLKKIIEALESHPMVIGSRYVHGGRTANWSWYRKLISRFGSLYSRLILGHPVQDWTGGFNGWKTSVLKSLDLATVRSEGYSFQIEMKYRAVQKSFHPFEVPILFEERREGASKMNLAIVIEAFYRVWQIRFRV